MTVAEVSEIMGGPPVTASGPAAGAKKQLIAPNSGPYMWDGGSAYVSVYADRGVVYGKSYYRRSPLDTLRNAWLNTLGTPAPF